MSAPRAAQRRIRVLLVANYGPMAQESMQRYADLLERELPAAGIDVSHLHPPVVLGRLGGLRQWTRFIDVFVLGPWMVRRAAKSVDVVHICDHTNAMYRLFTRGRKAVVTCHDLHAILVSRGEVAGERAGLLARLHQRWIAFNLARVACIICVSRATERELRRCLPLMRADVRVIENPLPWQFSPASGSEVARLRAHVGLGRATEYFLCVGSNAWYKNRLGALRIFAELRKLPRFRDTALVMAGAPLTPEMCALRHEAGLEDAIIEQPNVSNEDLRALYTDAFALLFPSLSEGFGWPIIEAQACGCAVVTSGRPPMNDVGGDAAIYIDPEQPRQAAAEILRRTPDLPAIRDRAIGNAARFPVTDAMQAYARVYADTVGA